ncbi:hypothetical protein [Geomicrobium sp. JCM 19037]|uniref:hypothetical protein n=1 Tax=Geomicrobium sp. JCM 19037 TaxID=1460634 RepID=UPI001EE689DD|nr:hypothetical protein [Geomicrobium sp. JCM 19037]
MKKSGLLFYLGMATVMLAACGGENEQDTGSEAGDGDTSWTDVQDSGTLVSVHQDIRANHIHG